jgi:hypothetical protein
MKVRVLRIHAKQVGLGAWRVGDIYEDNTSAVHDRIKLGFVEPADGPQVNTKESRVMYRDLPVVSLVARSGNWYVFSDGERLLGRVAASAKLGVSAEELAVLCAHLNTK